MRQNEGQRKPAKVERKKRIAIIGAGVSGLAVGMKLSEYGYEVKVFEKSDRVGGLARTIHRSGHTMDLGVHSLYPSRPDSAYVVDYFKSIMPGGFLTIDKKTTIFWQGKFISYPLAADQMFTTIGWRGSVKTILDFIWQRFRVHTGLKKDIQSFADWVTYHFGNELYKIYFKDYVVKTWGMPANELSAKWLGRRVKKLSIRVEIINLLTRFIRGLKYKEGSSGLQPVVFPYAIKGSGQVPQKMKRVIEKFDGKFIFNAYPEKIKVTKQALTLHFKERDIARKEKFDYLVSTVPINDFVHLVDPPLPVEILDAAEDLRFRAMRLVFILLDKNQVFDSQWTYFHDKEYIFNRINEFKNIFEGFSPFEKTSLVCEITCFVGDDIWRMTDEELYEKTVKPLIMNGFMKKDEVSDWFVKNLSHAYPIFKVDSMKRVNSILEYLDSLDLIYTIGRQGRFQYINMDECIHQGFTTAQQIHSKLLEKL